MEDRVWSFRNVSSIWRELEVETWDVLPSVRISLFLARFEHGSCEERDRVILGLLGGVWKICYFTHTWGNHPIWQTCLGKSSNLTSISISFKYLKHLKPATSKSASSDSLWGRESYAYSSWTAGDGWRWTYRLARWESLGHFSEHVVDNFLGTLGALWYAYQVIIIW